MNTPNNTPNIPRIEISPAFGGWVVEEVKWLHDDRGGHVEGRFRRLFYQWKDAKEFIEEWVTMEDLEDA